MAHFIVWGPKIGLTVYDYHVLFQNFYMVKKLWNYQL